MKYVIIRKIYFILVGHSGRHKQDADFICEERGENDAEEEEIDTTLDDADWTLETLRADHATVT